VAQKVCSQTQDPSNYATCTASSSWIELSDLNAFLDWMANAGQPGGAPNGAVLTTARSVLIGADTTAPSTTISCDGSACPSGAVPNVVHATFSATDVGSSVASTHYTTDGSDPTLASPTYSKSVAITSPTTVKYRSWDHTGNAEAVQSQFIQATPPADTTPPATTISCNGSPCSTTGYNGSVSVTLSADDGTGWGVDSTYYTTDGSQPTTSSPVYGGPFQLVPGTYTVQFFSTDLAGNAEQVHSQQIVVLPPKVVVSLTFDDSIDNQYSLGFKRAMQPHGMHGTFFVITNFPNVNSDSMTWSQITALNQGGNEIGAHTMNHVNLKTTTDYQTKVNEVCGSRQALLDHGFYPASFAYPEGAYDATAESIVQGCGFTSGRAAGGIDVAGDGAGPLYAEGLPPTDRFATKTVYDPPTGTPLNVPPLGLSHMEAAINGAAQHGGGWIQLVFHQVCSQTYDPDNYDSCMADWGPIDLPTLNGLLDWLQSAGQPGGAPPSTVVQTISQVIDGPDTQPPVTQLLCNGAPCRSSMYSGSVDVALSATDPGGSGVAATYYTTDGSTPTPSSPTFSTPFIITRSETLTFYSVDNAGNAEQVRTITVLDEPHADPVVGAAGDIACDPTAPAFNGGDGTATDCRAKATGNLMTGVDAVLPLGDTQYDCGGMSAYLQSYDPAWGRFKPISHPVPGDKEYESTGTGCPSTPGADYFAYFGASAGDPSRGYYSYDVGSWHVIALNTGPCPSNPAFCASGSAQEQWLQQELAANNASCTLAYFQNPRFSSTSGGGSTTYEPFWQDLYGGGVSTVLNGDSHWYERFVPMDGSGSASAGGMREFIVGTGGAGLDTPSSPLATSAALNANTHGVLKLVLHQGSYDWSFVHDSDGTFTDSGSAQCRPQQDRIAPTTTISCNGGSCAGTFSAAVSVALAATDSGGSGVDKTYYTLDGSTPTTSSTVYTGPFSVPATTTVKYFSTDVAGNAEAPQSQTVSILLPDTAPPTTTASCNDAACAGTWYRANVSLTLTATDTGGSGVDKTYYTLDGSAPDTNSTVYTAPLTLTGTTTVRFFSTDLAGNREANQSLTVPIDQAAPTTTITCAASDAGCTQAYQASVTVSLFSSDSGGSGVSATYFTLDGSAPSSQSTLYTGPFQLGATTTVRYFSIDNAGNAEASGSSTVTVNAPPRDTTAPVTTIACNGGSCAGWFRSAVTVTLSATDTGGSGVSATYYTVNGSTPTTSSTRYTGAFAVTSTTTVKFFSTDGAGNAEVVQSTVVQIDAAAPTTTISCNNGACGAWFTAAVTARLAATDTGGSGVATIRYTVDGTNPNTSTTAIVYTGPFTVASTQTVRFASTDVAGNQETAKSQQVKVDMAAPSVAITSPADSASFVHGATISITASAADTGSGGQPASGVATVALYVDGKLKSTDRNSPWSFSWSTKKQDVGTHVLTAVATDVAGNSTTSAPVTIRVT
jgi:peptidoglycan/xylan/chitin deacetylase (PgdA/CDA1 family)